MLLTLHKDTCQCDQHWHTSPDYMPTTHASSWGIGCIRTADVLASISHQLLAVKLHALPSTVKAKLL